MKHLHLLPVLLGGALLAAAQTVPEQAAAVAAPQAPVPPVAYQPLPSAGASTPGEAAIDWKAANATVGRYRGHQDIIKWERARDAGRQAPTQEPAR